MSVELAAPSLTVSVIVALPLWLLAGVTVTVRFAPLPPSTMFASGTNVVLLLLPLRSKSATAVSTSPTVTDNALVAVSSLVDRLLTSLIVGASFTASTVNTNVSVVLAVPSPTVSVIVALPFWLLAGVTVTVQLAPLPPNTMFASGTNTVLLLLALNVRSATAVSSSPNVTANALVAVSSLVDTLLTSLIVGTSFTGRTSIAIKPSSNSAEGSVTRIVNEFAPTSAGSGVPLRVPSGFTISHDGPAALENITWSKSGSVASDDISPEYFMLAVASVEANVLA